MESPLPPNPYKTLNIAKDATLATIKSAHRKLVLTCHPDKIQDEAVKQQKSEQFHEVQRAYEILVDETKRQRYDDRVKLAELQAEVLGKGGLRTVPDPGSRSRPSPVFETRGDRIYEERVPNRSFEDDPFSAKFQEYRPTSRKFDDHYSTSTSRRSSGRVPDETRKSREPDEDRDWERYDRQAKKDASKKANHGNKKKSDRDKRRDREAKFSSKSPYVEDDTDSDITERYSSPRYDTVPKRRHDDVRRRDREDLHRRSTRRDDSDTMDDVEHKTTTAKDYIEKSRRGASTEVEPRRPASGVRHVSNYDFRTTAPLPTIIPADSVRRSSGRARESRKSSPVRLSAKDRRMTEIVDPPDRRTTFVSGSSDPRGLKNLGNPSKREPLRASTERPIIETRQPPPTFLRRSETMPSQSNSRRAENIPSRPKNSETNDSGYSSSGTPELYQGQSPQLRTTTYKINEYDDDSRPTVYREPETYYERDRDISPRPRRQEDRPAMTARAPSGARGSLPRANTHFHPEPVQSPRQPPLSHTESSRGPPPQTRQSSRINPQLYGEVSQAEDYKVVHQSRKLRNDDIKFSGGRDTYPSSQFEPRHHSNLSRHESRATASY